MTGPSTPTWSPSRRRERSSASVASPTSSPRAAPPQPATYQSFEDLFDTPASPHSKRSILGSPSFFGSPGRRANRRAGRGGDSNRDDRDGDDSPEDEDREEGKQGRWLTTLDLINLTVGLGGAQLTWTVEMAYGTPYLLELGLTKEGTSLVWMAGPLSGLLIQPLVGALSDASTTHYRRRFYIALSALLIVISTLVVAFAREVASVLCSLGGIGDWDPDRIGREGTVAIWIGVVGFYVLDFSLNGLQASMRALVLDISPTSQQNASNAWLGRQTHIANIFGYLCGFFDLGSVPALRWIGGGQFRRLGVISCLIMTLTVVVTCMTQHEEARVLQESEDGKNAWTTIFSDVKDNIKNLPLEVRRVCYVQFFAWTAWFPFLFYATTYVAETLYSSIPRGQPLPSPDDATRAGSLALLIYAIVSLSVGTFLPWLTSLGDKPFVQERVSFSTKTGRAIRWVLSMITMTNCWTMGLWAYVLGTAGTFLVTGPNGAMAFVAFQGFSWAVTCWVPFALVMEYIRELGNSSTSTSDRSGSSSPTSSSAPASPSVHAPSSSRPQQPFRALNRHPSYHQSPPTPHDSPTPANKVASERSPLIAQRPVRTRTRTLSYASSSGSKLTAPPVDHTPPSGGTILGLHNLAIVAPQFLVAIASAIIFKITSDSPGGGGGGGPDELRSTNDVVWVLRFGGLAAIGGAIASRWIVQPRTERELTRKMSVAHFTTETRDKSKPLSFLLMGTGSSAAVPDISCVTNPAEGCQCCLDTLPGHGGVGWKSKNRRKNTGGVLRVPQKSGREATILIDCGKTFRDAALLQFPRTGLRQIDACILTHHHADAIDGLDDLRAWTYQSAIQRTIPIFCTQTTYDNIKIGFPYLVNKDAASGSGKVPDFAWHILDTDRIWEICGVEIVPLPVHHGLYFNKDPVAPLICLGFLFDASLLYMSDVSYIPEDIWDLLSEHLDLPSPAGGYGGSRTALPRLQGLVIDTAGLRMGLSHFGLPQAIATARRLGAIRTYFTNIPHMHSHAGWLAFSEAFEKHEVSPEATRKGWDKKVPPPMWRIWRETEQQLPWDHVYEGLTFHVEDVELFKQRALEAIEEWAKGVLPGSWTRPASDGMTICWHTLGAFDDKTRKRIWDNEYEK
ncbi:hypothetical protein JCM10212_003081 [Sporobolomyces blumeae]